MPQIALNPQFIKDASCPPDKRKVDYFDIACKGLLLEIRISGGKTYYLRYQDGRGKVRQIKLADSRDVSLTQARQLADKCRSQIAMGEDPLTKKADLKKVPKLENFTNETYLPFVETYKRSWKCDRGLLNNHVLPIFGRKYMDEISKQDIIKFIAEHRTTHAPGSVNRVIILLRYMFNLAIKWETTGLTKNPTSGIPLLEENNKKERYLTSDEAQRLLAALQESCNPMLQFMIPMLILTGARKMEVFRARWEDFNIEQRIWRIPLTKSGKCRHVPISDGVVRLLANVPRICEYAFPNPKTKEPYDSVFGSWDTARKSVGLSDVRLHDLRHSFASFLINNGRSLYEVQKILGHTQVKTTQRYAHLSQESLIAAANEASIAVPISWAMPNQVSEVHLLQVVNS
jgi:integrase